MNKSMVYLDNRIIFSLRNELSSHELIWRKLKCILLSEKTNLKRLHIVIPTKSHGNGKKISGFQGKVVRKE